MDAGDLLGVSRRGTFVKRELMLPNVPVRWHLGYAQNSTKYSRRARIDSSHLSCF